MKGLMVVGNDSSFSATARTHHLKLGVGVCAKYEMRPQLKGPLRGLKVHAGSQRDFIVGVMVR
eukprot:scaffold37639_cov184-Skeletonema_marinoi.AAC.2